MCGFAQEVRCTATFWVIPVSWRKAKAFLDGVIERLCHAYVAGAG